MVQRAVVNGGDDGGAGKGRSEIFQQWAAALSRYPDPDNEDQPVLAGVVWGG